jgi:hypothetical protein
MTFRSDGQRGWDDHDGYELRAPAQGTDAASKSLLSLYSVREDGTGIGLSNLPYDLNEKVTIPVEPALRGCDGSEPFVGDVKLTWPDMRNIPADWKLEVRDTQTGNLVNLRADDDSTYTFTLESSTSSSTCATATSSKSSSTTVNSTPKPPFPEVVSHDVAKSGEPSTRFEFIITPNTALPVEFSSFTGSVADNAAKLEWTTATEQNNAGFQVQRKVDGSFQNIEGAFVEGAGTSEEPQSYSYRVEDLDAGQHTFRLKQVDVDGGSSFSKETTVKVGLDRQYELKAYPNPISEQATIKFAVKESQDVTLELYNTLGQRVQVLHQGSVPSSQTRTVSLQASDLSSGLYIVRMRGESFSTTKSVTVVR